MVGPRSIGQSAFCRRPGRVSSQEYLRRLVAIQLHSADHSLPVFGLAHKGERIARSPSGLACFTHSRGQPGRATPIRLHAVNGVGPVPVGGEDQLAGRHNRDRDRRRQHHLTIGAVGVYSEHVGPVVWAVPFPFSQPGTLVGIRVDQDSQALTVYLQFSLQHTWSRKQSPHRYRCGLLLYLIQFGRENAHRFGGAVRRLTGRGNHGVAADPSGL